MISIEQFQVFISFKEPERLINHFNLNVHLQEKTYKTWQEILLLLLENIFAVFRIIFCLYILLLNQLGSVGSHSVKVIPKLGMSSLFINLIPLPFHFLIGPLSVMCFVGLTSCSAKDLPVLLVKPPWPF